MKRRCYNRNRKDYRHYGLRGIKVCPEWHSFMGFYISMGYRPDGRSLDRINPDGNYGPDNCRWATRSEQAMNCRPGHSYFGKPPHLITMFGETRRITEWSKMTGINRHTIADRLERGWDSGEALLTPVKPRKKRRKPKGDRKTKPPKKGFAPNLVVV